MRSIEDIATEEEARVREITGQRIRRLCLWLGAGLSLWGWTLFYQGQTGKGALAIIWSFLFLGAGWGAGQIFKTTFPVFFMGLLAGAFPLCLYHFTRLPSFYWGKDPAFWLSVHGGAVVEPPWSPLGYLLAQAACFVFPQRSFALLPEISSIVLSSALFLAMIIFSAQFKNKSALNLGLGLMLCCFLAASLPFWNAATVASGLTASLGLSLFLIQKSLLNREERPWRALYLLLGLLGSVHPLWGTLGLLAHLGSLDFEGKKVGGNLFAFFMGWTPYLWIAFRVNHFFPSWGGDHPFLEWIRQGKGLWRSHLTEDWALGSAFGAWGWMTVSLVFFTLILLFLNFFRWKAGNKHFFPAVNFWIWVFSGVGGVLFFSLSSEALGPIALCFSLGLADLFLRLLERGMEKRHGSYLSGTRLAGVAGAGILATFGLVLLPDQQISRSQFYFPQQHALNLLQALSGPVSNPDVQARAGQPPTGPGAQTETEQRVLLVCDDSFEAEACLAARLMEPVALPAVILEKKYLNQRWYVGQCVTQAPRLLFSNLLGSSDGIFKDLILNNRDDWTIHWAVSVLPPDWREPKAFSAVLTQMFEGKTASHPNPEDIQYRYDLTGLPRPNESMDPQASRYFSRYVEGFNELGKSLMAQGFYVASIRAFDRSLKLDPVFAEPQSFLSKMYSQQNILAAAQLDFEKIIKTHPAKIKGLIGELEKAQKDQNESQSVGLLDGMIRLNSELADAQYQLSVIYNQQGRTQESKALLESSVQLNPKQIEAQMSMGHLMARVGNRLKAEEAFRAVLGINQENKEAQVELWKLLNKP